jgi:hypothetical protein
MTVFACVGCDATLTRPLQRVVLPVQTGQSNGYRFMGPLMEPGTYAVNPDHFGPPWRPEAEIDAEALAARGWYVPGYGMPEGPRGAVVIAPGDVRGTVFIPERLDGYCCGLTEHYGLNLACAQCGRPVATRVDDCSRWQAVWLDPRAVRRVSDAGSARTVMAWEDLGAQRPSLPPMEPAGQWSVVWSAVIADALARVVAVSGGRPVTVPDGPAAAVFRRALDALLPPGPPTRNEPAKPDSPAQSATPAKPARNVTLAGPGLPVRDADIVLVPQHPQTGACWPAPEAADAVPLAFDVWAYLAFHRNHRALPGADPTGDGPLPPGPTYAFRPDWLIFRTTLARMPEVRQPWLRAIHDRVWNHPYTDPF